MKKSSMMKAQLSLKTILSASIVTLFIVMQILYKNTPRMTIKLNVINALFYSRIKRQIMNIFEKIIQDTTK